MAEKEKEKSPEDIKAEKAKAAEKAAEDADIQAQIDQEEKELADQAEAKRVADIEKENADLKAKAEARENADIEAAKKAQRESDNASALAAQKVEQDKIDANVEAKETAAKPTPSFGKECDKLKKLADKVFEAGVSEIKNNTNRSEAIRNLKMAAHYISLL
jgi:hypothetical protein